MNKLLLIVATVFLSGCAGEPIKLLAPEYKVVKIPDTFYECPTIKKFPDANKLTNQQVGSLLIKAQKNNMMCKNSLDNIKKYVTEAEKTVAKK